MNQSVRDAHVTSMVALTVIRREASVCSLLTGVFLNSKGVTDVLCEACDQLGWTKPTKIQIEAIPLALQGKLKLNLCPGADSV